VAQKVKTPPPPRRVQAPKTRVDQSDERRTRLVLLGAAALGFVGLAVAVALFAFGGGGSADVEQAVRDAGGTFKTVKSPFHESDHSDVPTLQSKVTWNTDPPSNGMHYGGIGIWGFYDEPVNPRMVVHNLEHGGLAIWWGPDVPQETVDRLREWYADDPVSVIGTPYPKLGDKIALTAWTGNPSNYFENGNYGEGHIAIFPRFDEKAFDAFKDAFRGKGPEGIPMENNQPGT
jgi:Protein of unknown function (DUF3105)